MDEMEALASKRTWELISAPTDVVIVGCPESLSKVSPRWICG